MLPTGQNNGDGTRMEATLSDLRDDLSRISDDVAHIVSERARSATNSVRSTIEGHPLPSILAGFAAGAILGLMFSGTSQRRGYIDDLRDTIRNYAIEARHQAAQAVPDRPIADYFERLMSALSSNRAVPAMDRLSQWFTSR